MATGGRLPGAPERSTERIVLHVDVDCFYAACERLREPELEGKPVVVGMGFEPGSSGGAVATASYEAREHGVESALGISKAMELLPPIENGESACGEGEDADTVREVGEADESVLDENEDEEAVLDESEDEEAVLDESEDEETVLDESEDDEPPHGHYRPVDMPYYRSIAERVRAQLAASADTLREVSIDEAYLDVTERTTWDTVESFAREIKARIEREVGLTVSIGVAPNMSAAKIASDHEKPNGLVVVRPGEVSSFLAPLPIEELHGIGPVTARTLRERDVETVGDLAAAERNQLVALFGERGRELHQRARGEDDREVEPMGRPKSLSRESAFGTPTDEPETVRDRLETLAAAVAARASDRGATYRTIGIKVVTPPYEVNTRERSLPGPVDDPDLVTQIAGDLLEEFADARVRKVGVRVSNLSFADGDQVRLDGWTADGDTDEEAMPSDSGETSGSEDEDLRGEASEGQGIGRTRRGQVSLDDFA